MKKRIITVFIFMLAIVFLTGNVYAGKHKKDKKYKKEVKRLEQELKDVNKELKNANKEIEALLLQLEGCGDTPDVDTGVIVCWDCDFSPKSPSGEDNFATLTEHNFRGADLLRADFEGADLSGSDFSGAILSGAILRGADLSGAVLDNVTWGYIEVEFGVSFRTAAICPDGQEAYMGGDSVDPDNPDTWTCVGHLTPVPVH